MQVSEVVLPGSFLVRYKSGCSSQWTAQVLADVDLLSRRCTVDRFLSGGHFYRLPLTLHS